LIHELRNGRRRFRAPRTSGPRIKDDGIGPPLYRDRRSVIVGAKLTELTQVQAEYIGVDVEGPYKPDH
jgi:S-adenosyl-L-homocysteine hydrolase